MTGKYNRESLQHSAQFFYMQQVQHLNNSAILENPNNEI